jgi:hypothetical protein
LSMQNRRRLVSRVSSNRWQHVAAIAAQRNVIAKDAARLKTDILRFSPPYPYSHSVTSFLVGH